jgi:predicted PurR-regulated permease PerM
MPDLPIPSDRPPVQVPPADTPGVRGLLTLAVAVVVVAGLYLGREVMIPITLAVLLSFLLAPLVNVLRRMHLGRVPSALLAAVLALGVILAFAALIGTQLAELAPDVPRYASAVADLACCVPPGVPSGRRPDGVPRSLISPIGSSVTP